MAEFKHSPFGRSRAIQSEIEDFLDRLAEGAEVFRQGMTHYLRHGADERVEQRCTQIDELEGRADELRRAVETGLYEEMLLPDLRGDLLRLLDDLDQLMDICKSRLMEIIVEQPDFGEALRPRMIELVEAVVNAMEHTVQAARLLMRDPRNVRDHVHKIMFHEGDADRLIVAIKRAIFAEDSPLSKKLFLRSWADSVDQLANEAEEVGDMIAIMALKRAL